LLSEATLSIPALTLAVPVVRIGPGKGDNTRAGVIDDEVAGVPPPPLRLMIGPLMVLLPVPASVSV